MDFDKGILSMGKFINRRGFTYGRLLVTEDAGVGKNNKRLWKCYCSCGKEKIVTAGELATGRTQSCGCLHKESITIHGGWKKSSYNTWRAMMRRCYNPNDKDFFRYGARGLTVCEEWKDYLGFVADMGEPVGDETLDRINNEKGYSKENCRWASGHVQSFNRRLRPNKTGYNGVSYLSKDNKWIANITVNKKRYYSSCYGTLNEAVQARKLLENTYLAKQHE
jgi:hypothetical protein